MTKTVFLPRTMRRFDRIAMRVKRIVRIVRPRQGENLAQAVERALEEAYQRGYAEGLAVVREEVNHV
ncbi:MAG: hypothetical protein HPY45_09885 [Anaerolineae bacterium]|nr:hypothetical protein [Anaerolineae bacterium]